MAITPAVRRYKPVNGKRFDALLRLCNAYYREARRCGKAKAWYAGSAMVGSALEAILLATCSIYDREVNKFIAANPPPRKLDAQMARWVLADLIWVATGIGWLPKRTHKNARLLAGDLLTRSQELRNLVHPGRHVRQHPEVSLKKWHYDHTHEIFEIATSWLSQKVHTSLAKKMAADARKAGKRKTP